MHHEPPETTGGPGAAGAGAGADAGGCGFEPLLLLVVGPLSLDDEDGAGTAALLGRPPAVLERLLTGRPWNALAAATEITPVRPTAPAISQRLIREISARPASRMLTLRGAISVTQCEAAPIGVAKSPVRTL
jgi:hypothetical protein